MTLQDLKTFLLHTQQHYNLPCPEIFIEGDDFQMINLDWCLSRNVMFSVHFYENGQIGWSALINNYRGSGRFTGPAWSDDFKHAISLLNEVKP